MIGSYPFNFESSAGFVDNLIQLDHAGVPWDEFYRLPQKVKEINEKAVAKKVSELFPWERQVIVILGSKSLVNKLRTNYKNLEVVGWKKFL